MPMTGKFGADFAEFYDEAAKSARALAMMAAGATDVDKTVGTMATTMEGSATTVSASVAQMGTTSTKTSNTFTTLATQMQTADKSLQAFGVSVQPVTNVLTEVGQVSGKTTTELGALGTATTALAVGLASFKATQFILELTGANKVLDDFYKDLFKFRSAGQEAGAAADVLAKASGIAGRQITDFAEAVRITAAASAAFTARFDTAANSVAKWENELAKARSSGNYGQLLKDMKDGNSTAEELQRRYHLSAEALEYLERQTKKQAAAWKDAHEPARKAAELAKQHAEAIQQLNERMLGGGAIKAAQDYVLALGPMSNLSKMATDETTKLNTAMLAALEAYTRAGTVAPQAIRDIYVATTSLGPVTVGLGSAWNSLGETIQVNAEKILETARAVQSQEQINQAYYKQLDAEIDAAYKSAQEGAKAATAATQETTGSVNQLASAYANVAQSAEQYKQLAAGLEFDAAYNTRQGGTAASIAMGQRQAAQGFRTQAGILEQRELAIGAATSTVPWGRQGSVSTVTNVGLTINAAGNGQDISHAVLDGMRRQGVRLGS